MQKKTVQIVEYKGAHLVIILYLPSQTQTGIKQAGRTQLLRRILRLTLTTSGMQPRDTTTPTYFKNSRLLRSLHLNIPKKKKKKKNLLLS